MPVMTGDHDAAMTRPDAKFRRIALLLTREPQKTLDP
jgi:hypothetical protein